MAKQKVKNTGVAFEYGERTLIVPSLSVRQMKTLAGKLVEYDNFDIFAKSVDGVVKVDMAKLSARLELLAGIVAEVVRRNYSDFTDEEAMDFVTVGNANQLLSAIIGSDRQSPQVREVGED